MKFTEWAALEFGVPVSDLIKTKIELNEQKTNLYATLKKCWQEVYKDAYDEGYEEGYQEGRGIGYDEGREVGYEDGRIDERNDFERQ